MKSKKKNGGFTLVELLATLAILSLVVSIVTYSAVGIVNNAKQKSYETTVNNIKVAAGNFAIEQVDESIKWDELKEESSCLSGKKCQYQCVSIEKLIEAGYFSADILDSYKSEGKPVKLEDMVYVERDADTKTITHKSLEHTTFCNNPPVEETDNTSPTVTLSSSNKIAKTQDLTITMSDDIGVDSYYFGKTNPSTSGVKYDRDAVPQEVITVTEPGTYYVQVTDKSGNVSEIKSITYSKTQFSVSGATVNPSYMITIENVSVTLPSVGNGVTLDSGNNKFYGWYSNSNYSVSVGTTYSPQNNFTLYGYGDYYKAPVSKKNNPIVVSAKTGLKYTGSAQTLVTTTNAKGTVYYGFSSVTSSNYKNFGTSLPQKTDAGTYIVYWYVTGNSSYYSDSGSLTVSISKANNPIVVSARTGLKYNGSAQTLVTTTNAKGTVYYGFSSVNPGNYRNFGTSLPQKTEAGTYTVYYHVLGDNNYSSKTSSVSVTISKDCVDTIPSDYVLINTLQGLYCKNFKMNPTDVYSSWRTIINGTTCQFYAEDTSGDYYGLADAKKAGYSCGSTTIKGCDGINSLKNSSCIKCTMDALKKCGY